METEQGSPGQVLSHFPVHWVCHIRSRERQLVLMFDLALLRHSSVSINPESRRDGRKERRTFDLSKSSLMRVMPQPLSSNLEPLPTWTQLPKSRAPKPRLPIMGIRRHLHLYIVRQPSPTLMLHKRLKAMAWMVPQLILTLLVL
jgi:hypothetical protein